MYTLNKGEQNQHGGNKTNGDSSNFQHPIPDLTYRVGPDRAAKAPLSVHADDAAERLSLEHVVESLVDLGEMDFVRDELLQLELLQK